MRFLVDTQAAKVGAKQLMYPHLVEGQLLTPLTKYKNWGGAFAIDNGAYTKLRRDPWFRLLSRNEKYIDKCLFVAIPDIVGSAIRTRELYFQITQDERLKPWTNLWSMVMQDGQEYLPIDWYAVRHIFIGGTDAFKDSNAAYDIVKTAKALGKPVHVGRVNTIRRYIAYAELGCDTCDGSGIARYDHMLENIASKLETSASHQQFLELKDEKDDDYA